MSATGTQSRPFELHNVHWAHSAGLTGAGSLIAVVDDGFRLTHREFAGKPIQQTGTLPLAGHGTLVVSLIAGAKDGQGMHGVAPGASLHLTSFQPTGSGSNLSNVTSGTLAAANLGAVAQNNSWGFNVSADTLKSYLANNSGSSVAQGMNAVVGHGSGTWQSYINALDTFQNTGVVVWALSNDENFASGDVMATLPYFEPRLAEAWITAANGYFEVNGSGDITRAVRLSAACGYAAQFCIAGDGIVSGAWSTSDTAYRSAFGTSFVAPQVSGAVALLAEAFPDMTPSEWAQRLLASADNSWFAGQGIPVAGVVDYGNGVSHAFSTEWGHGVMDLKAALSPIGTVSVLSGTSVSSAERYSLAESTIAAPSSFGDSLQQGLAQQELAVFDSLNRAYSVAASSPVISARVSALPSLPGQRSLDQAELGLGVMHTRDLAKSLGGFDGAGGDASVFSMAGESLVVASTAPMGLAELTTYGFASEHGSVGNGHLAGAGLTLDLPVANGKIRVGATVANETGGVLGLKGSPAFGMGSGSALGVFDLGIEQNLAPGLSVFGGLEVGRASPLGASSGLVSDLSDLTFSSMEMGASFASALVAGDRLTLSIAQPVRVESGTVALTMPIARRADGSVANETSDVQLSSSSRQLDLSLAYQTEMPNDAALSIGMKHAINAGHVAGQAGTGVMLGYRQGF